MPLPVANLNVTNILLTLSAKIKSGIFSFSILGRGPRAFQIGKSSAVDP